MSTLLHDELRGVAAWVAPIAGPEYTRLSFVRTECPVGPRLCSSAVLAPVNRLRDSGYVASLPSPPRRSRLRSVVPPDYFIGELWIVLRPEGPHNPKPGLCGATDTRSDWHEPHNCQRQAIVGHRRKGLDVRELSVAPAQGEVFSLDIPSPRTWLATL